MAKKIHILKDELSEDMHVLGLVTSESIFQLILLLNNNLDLSFKLIKPISIDRKAGCATFPCAMYETEDVLKIYLIKNKAEGQVLFKNQTLIDYLIVLSGVRITDTFQKISFAVKSIKPISISTPVELKKLKNIKSILI